jgi:general secretion pathway protein B
MKNPPTQHRRYCAGTKTFRCELIQQEIPVMSIPVHTYSTTPKERVVGINDRLLQEGDYLAPGLKLEQIAPDGVIFSYKNYLFRHGL